MQAFFCIENLLWQHQVSFDLNCSFLFILYSNCIKNILKKHTHTKFNKFKHYYKNITIHLKNILKLENTDKQLQPKNTFLNEKPELFFSNLYFIRKNTVFHTVYFSHCMKNTLVKNNIKNIMLGVMFFLYITLQQQSVKYALNDQHDYIQFYKTTRQFCQSGNQSPRKKQPQTHKKTQTMQGQQTNSPTTKFQKDFHKKSLLRISSPTTRKQPNNI
eukprot:TRINITY_DN23692_c0_g2_i1.p1 TRINITY_DN23692_c0_g2~~TRINITY_DN23692_c0_g2_i1.p1  ORF type:complete len:216 (-),score=-12.56 TRINITY_DN23692_c0_g2_i1:69-716(-)